jgi:hypothetical protein
MSYLFTLVPLKTGNEGGFFEMHDQTGELFLVREIDLESLPNPILSLQIQVSLSTICLLLSFMAERKKTIAIKI